MLFDFIDLFNAHLFTCSHSVCRIRYKKFPLFLIVIFVLFSRLNIRRQGEKRRLALCTRSCRRLWTRCTLKRPHSCRARCVQAAFVYCFGCIILFLRGLVKTTTPMIQCHFTTPMCLCFPSLCRWSISRRAGRRRPALCTTSYLKPQRLSWLKIWKTFTAWWEKTDRWEEKLRKSIPAVFLSCAHSSSGEV